MKDIKVGHRNIGLGHAPFIIAEMSGNHNQSLARAIDIVDAAAASGAHALKLQTYTADTITLDSSNPEFMISDKNSLWSGKSLHALYQEAHTPWEWHEAIFNRCKEKGMIFLSTPFDDTAVDFLEKFNPPIYKIASFENTHLPLIRKVAQTRKPIIISTGMAKVAEIDEAVETALKNGAKDVILLKCTSTYPADPSSSNISTIRHLRELFGGEVGLSDHTAGIGVAVASVAFGATVIEKHFTLARADGGVDSAFSIEPAELKALVEETERAWRSIGTVSYGVSNAQEQKSTMYRRSLYVSRDMKEGEVLTLENMKCVRPALGLAPKFQDFVLGKKVNQPLKRGTPLKWEHLG